MNPSNQKQMGWIKPVKALLNPLGFFTPFPIIMP